MKTQLRRLEKVKSVLRAKGLGDDVIVGTIVWRAERQRLPAGTRLEPGQRVVHDHQRAHGGQAVRLVDRVTSDPTDTGHLLDEKTGKPIGVLIPDARPGVFVYETNELNG